jgi:hypothetical protein
VKCFKMSREGNPNMVVKVYRKTRTQVTCMTHLHKKHMDALGVVSRPLSERSWKGNVASLDGGEGSDGVCICF